MTDHRLVPFDRVFWEVRYPVSLLFQDHIGALAHTSQALFPNVAVSPVGEVTAADEAGEVHIRVSPVHSWFSPPTGSKLGEFLQWARPFADRVLRDLLGVASLSRVGLRTYNLLAVESTEVAIDVFKRSVCDYYSEPWNSVEGTPSSVGVELRKEGWAELGDARFDCRLMVTPIQLPDMSVRGVEKDPALASMSGALLFDVDGYLADDQVVSLDAALALPEMLGERTLQSVEGLGRAFMRGFDELRKRA